ncbi:RES domain-containing protein [Mesorhizobium sp.]|uniref:RES domain-containing protein n=1 Tax=Mesorhizobium sp. TaxID=1871066 RepID=UPI00345B791B
MLLRSRLRQRCGPDDRARNRWATALSDGNRPASWSIYDRLRHQGIAGILVPRFAPSAETENCNLVLWDSGPDFPHRSHDVLRFW